MEMSDYLKEAMVWKDVWNSAEEMYGALSVMTTGIIMMLELYVISWA